MIAPSASTSTKNKPQRLTPKYLILLSVVALAVIASLIICLRYKPTQGTVESKQHKSTSIATSKTSHDNPMAYVRQKVEQPIPPQKPHEVRDGMLMLSNGKLLPTNKLRKVSIEDRKPRFQYAIFDHSTDNELAAILTLRPGQALIGGPIRRKDYKSEFLKSIETPVIVHKDDPEDVQEVKRAVIEARLQIKEAIDNGEDPAKIINDAYQEAQRLALYKDDIRREVMNLAKEGDYSEAEVDDLIAAANKMLEAKGIEPMKLGPIMKARLKTLKR